MPLVQVWGVNQRFRRSASSASVRAPQIPSASTTSGWKTSSASPRQRAAELVEGPRHLTAGDPHAGLLAQHPHPGQVLAGERLLDPQHAVLAQALDHAARARRGRARARCRRPSATTG